MATDSKTTVSKTTDWLTTRSSLPTSYAFTVTGKRVTIQSDSHYPLLWALRDDGLRFGTYYRAAGHLANPTRATFEQSADAPTAVQQAATFDPNCWVTIRRDGTTVIESSHSEQGQGILTGIMSAMVDEADSDWDKVEVHEAGLTSEAPYIAHPSMARRARESVRPQLPRMLIARDMTATIVASEIVLSSIISILARDVSGMTSVVLNAVAVEYPRNR
jgi:hypothetical protein